MMETKLTHVSNHNYILVETGVQKFNTKRLLPVFGVIKKNENDKYNKNIFDGFKKKSGVYVWLKVQDNKKVVDAGLVRTYSTLKKLDEQFKKENCTMLLHPYAVTIPEGFWLKWKTANNPQDCISLIKEHNLIKDEAIYKIDKIVLDIDTPIEYAQWQLEEIIFPELDITEGYEIGKTKSGNTRVILYLKWPLKANDIFRKQKHLERLRELYYFLVDLFYYRGGLKLDRTFADRINHPIWFSFNSHFYQKIVSKPGKIPFYTLYGRVKQIQRKAEYWVTRDNLNLTMKFCGDRRPKRKSTKVQLPAFLRNELKQYFDEDYKLTLWKKAVKSLYKGKGNRFINFILPAIGWAKYLNLNRIDVDTYLMKFLADRDISKTEKDLNIAWKYANVFEFRLPDNGRQVRLPANLDLIQITEKALNLVKQSPKTRQELLHEIFYKQAWLCDLVMNFFEKKGLIKSEFVSSGKRGRPSKVYKYIDNNNNNRQQNSNYVKNNNKKEDNRIVLQKDNNNTVHNQNTKHVCLHKELTKNIKTNMKQNIEQTNKQQEVKKQTNDNNTQFADKHSMEAEANMISKTGYQSVQIPSIFEYIQSIKDEKIKTLQNDISKLIYVYDHKTKQRIRVPLFTLYQYENMRVTEIKWTLRVVTDGFRLPIIRYERDDCVFKHHFGKFTFEKNSVKTDDFVFTLEPKRSDEIKFKKPKLNFKILELVKFKYPAFGIKNIGFIDDIISMKIWVNPKEFEKFYFPHTDAKTYFEKLAKDFYRDNPKIKWYTIKDRKYYAKARSISQKEQRFMQFLAELTKDKSYWYMQAKQMDYESIPAEQRKQAFSKLNLQLNNRHRNNYNDYCFSLTKSENVISFTIKNNLPWLK